MPRRRMERPAGPPVALPAAALAAALVPSALDLLAHLRGQPALAGVALASCALSGAALAGLWLRHPRAAWLAAAALAFVASAALRPIGGAPGPALSLLGLLSLGVGGAFRSREDAPGLLRTAAAPSVEPAAVGDRSPEAVRSAGV